MRTTCLLALLSLWLLALASAAPKKIEKKSIANSLAPKAIEPVEQKLDAPSSKISDEALMETAGETVGRAKKQTSTTFCVEIKQNKPTYVDCNESGGDGNKVFVVQGGGNEPNGQDDSGPSGGLPGPTSPLVPGGLPQGLGPHVLHLPGHHLPHHPGLHLPGQGTDGTPVNIHYLIPGGDGSGLGPHGFGPNGFDPNGLGPNGLGPNGLGPNGLGPNGLGPNGLGPHGLGPHGFGPNGLGPNGFGPNGFGPNGFGPGSNGLHYNIPGMGGGPNDGGLNGILYQLPGGFPGDSGGNGVGPNGVHVHVHPNGGFNPGAGGPGESSPNGVHLHLPTGSGGVPSGGSQGSPIHLSGIECLCAGTPAGGRDGEGNDGTPSNEALAVKFLQDLQKNDNMQDVDSAKTSTDDKPPSDQSSGSPTIVLPKVAGMPYALPMMIGGIPMMRTGYSPYGLPYGILGGDSPMTSGMPLMRVGDGSTPNGSPAGGGVPTLSMMPMIKSSNMPYISPYGTAYGLPLTDGGMPMMRSAGGWSMMGGMPMMRNAGGWSMMGGMPMMRNAGGWSMMGGMPMMRNAGGWSMMGGMPMMGSMPMMAKSSEDPKPPNTPIMIQMPATKTGEEPKNPTTPNGVHLTITGMPMGQAGEDPKNPTTSSGMPMSIMGMPMMRAGDGSKNPTTPNGLPMSIMGMPMMRVGDDPKNPTTPNGLPMTIMGMPMMRVGDDPKNPTTPNGLPMSIMGMPMMRAGENPMIPTLPNGLQLPIMSLAGMKTNDQPNSPSDGKMDPTMLLRYYPMRPPQQYPMHNPMYHTGPQMMHPMYQMPQGGYMGPHQGFGYPGHRSLSDCLQDSFQTVPAVQGLRFSRGPDESDLPPSGQQADADAKSENPPSSEHAEPVRSQDEKESRISQFIVDEHNDDTNIV